MWEIGEGEEAAGKKKLTSESRGRRAFYFWVDTWWPISWRLIELSWGKLHSLNI